jgi:DNA-directed RNA polymerase subunit L
MKVQILKEDKDYLEIKLDGEDLGLASIVAAQLVSSGEASFAHATLDHPITANPVLRIRDKTNRKELVAAAASKAAKELAAIVPQKEAKETKKKKQ